MFLRNLAYLCLLTLATLSFSGCSTTPIAQPPQVILIVPPDSLLEEQPVVRVINVSRQGIAEGYIPNTIHLGIANQQVRDLKRWKAEQIKLHGVPDVDTTEQLP